MLDRPIRFGVAFAVVAVLTLLITLFLLINLYGSLQWQAMVFLILMALVGLYAGIRYARWVEQSWEPELARCEKCRYLLKGLESNRCPECGTEFDVEAVRQEVAELSNKADG